MTNRFVPHACLLGLSALLGACGGGDSSGDAGTGTTAQKVASCGNDGGTLRIMPLGDSITEGERGHDSYRRVLWQRLNGAGCMVDLVGSKSGVSKGSRDSGSESPPHADYDQDHEAYWGYSVNELLPRVSGLVGQSNPDVVLIHVGTNDVLDGQSASGVASELGGMIDAIRASKPDVHILLAKIIPASPNATGTSAFNRLIEDLASRRSSAGSPIKVVDQASGYAVSDNYDGVHPGPSGESKLGNKWADALLAWRTI